jgi:cell division protein YceG involved in septum cleavage
MDASFLTMQDYLLSMNTNPFGRRPTPTYVRLGLAQNPIDKVGRTTLESMAW